MSLKIIQISDCHLRADPRVPYRGQNADENLKTAWQKASNWGPDIVLLTGDLSEDASPASYQRLAATIQTGAPILALPGNHDDPDPMRQHFPAGPWDGPFAYEREEWLIVMMDSKLRGRIEGGFSDQSLQGLREVLAQSIRPNVLLALHHQPIPVGAQWIDRFPLSRPAAFLDVVDSDPRIRCVIWGHIHHHFAADRNGVVFLGAPSTSVNSLAFAERFDVDAAGPACRTLELADSGEVVYGLLSSEYA